MRFTTKRIREYAPKRASTGSLRRLQVFKDKHMLRKEQKDKKKDKKKEKKKQKRPPSMKIKLLSTVKRNGISISIKNGVQPKKIKQVPLKSNLKSIKNPLRKKRLYKK